MEKLVNGAVKELVDANIVSAEESDIYEYGLRQMILMSANIITAFMIGAVFHMIFESIIFLGAYVILRIFAGGYHAKTPVRCYVFGVALMTFAMLIIKNINVGVLTIFVIMVFAGIVIFCFAPMENHNKPLDKSEVSRYKFKTRFFLAVEVLIFMVALAFDKIFISECIATAMIAVAGMLIGGYLKDKADVKTA